MDRRAIAERLTGLVAAGLLASAAAASGLPEAGDPAYRDELIARARALRLHETREWRALLHYEQRPLRRLRSRATTQRFFADPQGASDPERELAATLAAFFEAAPRAGADDPPQCAFRARFHWLDAQLGFDPARLPRLACANYDAWRARLPDERLTLVFPESFLDNPASMFGHTLLRIDTGERSSQLLGYAIDFTGEIGDDGAVAYLAKGPVGAYAGLFAVNPYYEKLKQYADWENRDIWEYELDFRPDELDLLLMHLWELRGIEFQYWFFDDNCSYQLLRLLEVARPDSQLGDGFPLEVLPLDSVRAVTRRGWVQRVRQRPSPASELRAEARARTGAERALARSLAQGETSPDDSRVEALPPATRAAVLDLAYDALRYDFLADRIGADDARDRSRRILVARSRLGRPPAADAESALPPRPDLGHGSARVSLGGGWSDGEGFLELQLRPALHDFLDPSQGYPAGNRIRVLDTRIRYLPERARVRLEELVLLDVASLSPRDRFVRGIAWQLGTGLQTRLVRDPSPGDDFDPEPVWRTGGGVGLAAAPARPLLAYALGEALLDVGPALLHDASFGPGARAGVFVDTFDDRLRSHVFAAVTRFALGDRTTWYRGGFEQRITLAAPLSLQLELLANRIDGDEWYEVGASLAFFF